MKRCCYVSVALVLLLFTGGFIFVWPLVAGKVYAGVTVEGVAMSGLTIDEVKNLLCLWRDEQATQQPFSVYYGEKVFPLAPQTVDYDVDVDATADEVMRWGRKGSLFERVQYICQAELRGHSVSLRSHYSEQKLENLIENWRESIDKAPRNAGFSILHGGMIHEETGHKLETSSLKTLIVQALNQSSGPKTLALPVTPLYPELTTGELAQTGLKELLATFTTTFNADDRNRSMNIGIAANKINGHIIYAHETFSFNDAVGPRDKEHGFKEAMEIVDNAYVPGIGGGICQVSSTLYNVALLANLSIVERYNHSKPLGYVGLGRDATVAYGTLDFKFTNDFPFPVMIVAEVQDNELCIGLFGTTKPTSETVKIVTENQQVISPAIVRKQDNALLLGETELDKQGKPGYEVTTVRVVEQDGSTIKREIIATDKYLPENTVVKFGTKMPDFSLKSTY
ncbi:vancomycin resistance protein YoaR [Sporomusaceae bacterium BoRhaA]|uniref:VanW family protein n=1 Tax=Pelorhabdus rhamnosifermentans TaxID=2772457 RepID=UPI001C061089|nr:VanW family protein [Pelorhabdus rhamnosifermentans]MBU2701595.1 vancomycin resistance protein YoaR [Pelorhabdus rhamnosifermentans]